MKTAAAELQAGFVETEETRAWDGHASDVRPAR